MDKPALGYDHDGCTYEVKWEPFRVPAKAFEYTLVMAIQQIGVNVLPSKEMAEDMHLDLSIFPQKPKT